MSSYKKNILVGVTIMVALFLLAWMVLRFSEEPMKWFFVEQQMPISMVAPNAEGVSEGSPIYYKGVAVGRVTAVRRSLDQRQVVIEALVDRTPPLPGNVEGRIRTQIIGGGSSISLALVPPEHQRSATSGPSSRPTTEPVEPEPIGVLLPHQQLTAKYLGFDIMPREFTDLAVDLRETGIELRILSRKFRESEIIDNLGVAINTFKTDLDKAGVVLDNVNKLVGDEKMQSDVRQSLENFRKASESARQIGADVERMAKKADARIDELGDSGNKLLANAQQQVDKIGKQMSDRMIQVANALAELESASRKLNKGDGSAAQLLNNPALYENLLDSSKELDLTLASFRRLIEQWEQEGVPLKLGGKK